MTQEFFSKIGIRHLTFTEKPNFIYEKECYITCIKKFESKEKLLSFLKKHKYNIVILSMKQNLYSIDGKLLYVLSYAKLRNNQLTRIGKLTKI